MVRGQINWLARMGKIKKKVLEDFLAKGGIDSVIYTGNGKWIANSESFSRHLIQTWLGTMERRGIPTSFGISRNNKKRIIIKILLLRLVLMED
jgi:hypothetical protein